ncbi:glucosaminidase domain-containing protein [Pseudoalteromonas sp. MMG013]|uniref:Bax protein n=1 Tax=Pseudoalteromonas aurantia 208 TaxID=1314867 RepID=A0ABR9E9S8_9GAMM|nr:MULTISPECIES: glucosaminidase domain-containing protein [Pseudoalteromonas]MBE0367735.1 Bax protein [Pseudoalteromonas aurantia 208]MBQ4845028.1 glucosaminidase domain-containing protein [Pseudoalteromonas sp. MMG005]MBQ4862867.1 glucosaminidase domain-containing protein [Pseudoalteromonas sp. MMG013]
MQVNVVRVVIFIVSLWGLAYPFLYKPAPIIKPSETTPVVIETPPIVAEKPLHTVRLPKFSQIKEVGQKKQQFFDFIKPHIIAENKAIQQQRASIEIALMMLQFDEVLTGAQTDKLNKIYDYYRLEGERYTEESLKVALSHVDVIPKELALMQAANESAWGTSRFARIGLNFFGQWCYKKGCGMVPRRRDNEAEHEVAAFQSVRAAVKSYFRNINTHEAYQGLRVKRSELRSNKQPVEATALTAGLISYSERGEAYVNELNDMIRHNKAYFDEE